jgi:hypothetical protein
MNLNQKRKGNRRMTSRFPVNYTHAVCNQQVVYLAKKYKASQHNVLFGWLADRKPE